MKLKIIFISTVIILLFYSAATVFAADVEVVGKIESQSMPMLGGVIAFKDSSTQQIVNQTNINPLGIYVVSVPQGTYDITFIPPAQSGLSPVTQYNQKFTTNSVDNIPLPAPPGIHPATQQSTGIPFMSTGIAVAILILLSGIAGYFLFRKK